MGVRPREEWEEREVRVDEVDVDVDRRDVDGLGAQ
jgi:hypothetical protein